MNFLSPDALEPGLEQPAPRSVALRFHGFLLLIIHCMAPLILLGFAGMALASFARGTPAQPGFRWNAWMLLYGAMGLIGLSSAWAVWQRGRRDLDLTRRGIVQQAKVKVVGALGRRNPFTLHRINISDAARPDESLEQIPEANSFNPPLEDGQTVTLLANPDNPADFILYRDSWFGVV